MTICDGGAPAADASLSALFDRCVSNNVDWLGVVDTLRSDPALAAAAARSFAHPVTGWTFLHAAAAAGSDAACRFLVSRGASLHARARGPTAEGVCGDVALREALRRAAGTSSADGPWEAPGPQAEPATRTASSAWREGVRVVARTDISVRYAGRDVRVRAGEPYWRDAWGRVLVGWHGTASPPRGMDGESMVPYDEVPYDE